MVAAPTLVLSCSRLAYVGGATSDMGGYVMEFVKSGPVPSRRLLTVPSVAMDDLSELGSQAVIL